MIKGKNEEATPYLQPPKEGDRTEADQEPPIHLLTPEQLEKLGIRPATKKDAPIDPAKRVEGEAGELPPEVAEVQIAAQEALGQPASTDLSETETTEDLRPSESGETAPDRTSPEITAIDHTLIIGKHNTADLLPPAQQVQLDQLVSLANKISARDPASGEVWRKIYDTTKNELSRNQTVDVLEDTIKLAREALMKLTGDILEIDEHSIDLPLGGKPTERQSPRPDQQRTKTQVVRRRGGAVEPFESKTDQPGPVSISEPSLPPHASEQLREEEAPPQPKKRWWQFWKKSEPRIL